MKDVGERALIDRIAALAGSPPPFISAGIGDDAAVLDAAPREQIVLTCDALVERVHFRLDWTSAGAIGRKAVAVNLSDIAAMGGVPQVVLLSLGLPASLSLEDFDALAEGAVAGTREAGAALIGGNITQSPSALFVDVTVMGRVHRRRVLRRSGGRPGDELWVTGTIGAAGAGLALLEAGRDRAASPEAAACVARYERPEPRLRIGRAVAGGRAATAAMDLSDGLADAARQVAEASGCGVVLEAEALPVDPAARAVFATLGRPAAQAALGSGEDYELLFAVPPKRRRGFLAAVSRSGGGNPTRVGTLTAEPGQVLLAVAGRKEPLESGFEHFAK